MAEKRQRDNKGRFVAANKMGNRFGAHNSGRPKGSKTLTARESFNRMALEIPVPKKIRDAFKSVYGYEPANMMEAVHGFLNKKALADGDMKAFALLYKASGLLDRDEEQAAQEKPKRITVTIRRTQPQPKEKE